MSIDTKRLAALVKEKLAAPAPPPGMMQSLLMGTAGSALSAGVLALGAHHLGPKFLKPPSLLGKGGVGRKALGLGALGLAVGGGAHLADSLLDKYKDKNSFKKNFAGMMSENPHLEQEDPTTIKKFFRTLNTFSPKMAKDPMVAGSFIKRSLQFRDEGIQPVDVKTLVDVEKSSRDAAKATRSNQLITSAFSPKMSELSNLIG